MRMAMNGQGASCDFPAGCTHTAAWCHRQCTVAVAVRLLLILFLSAIISFCLNLISLISLCRRPKLAYDPGE